MSRDFTRTRLAIEAFDREVGAAWAAVHAIPAADLDEEDIWRAAKLERECGRAVGHAFGLDTAGINNLADCEAMVRPDIRLRKLVGLE